jgi:methylase of polypeptide subunit release factors
VGTSLPTLQLATPLAHHDPPRIAELRSALWTAGFKAARVSQLLGAGSDNLSPSPSQISLINRELDTTSPLATLIRLFLLGLPVAPDVVTRALAPLSATHAVEMGLLRERQGAFEASVRLIPHDEFIFACSKASEFQAVESNHVMGVTRSSVSLANLTVRRPVGAALDLGTGCGIQAVLASRHASRVIAVDLNPEALRFTEFNTRLNGIDNIECRVGNLFEPVQDMTFDLIVANPPFVISPETRFLYRDGGMPGDELSRRVVSEAPRYLSENGMAHIMVSWLRRLGDEWSARLRGWVQGSDCDAWLLHQATQTALAHAASWHQSLAASDPTAFEVRLDQWLEYMGGLGMDGVAFGAVILRRRGGSNWVRAEEIPETDHGPAGDQLGRLFANQDFLAALPDRKGLLDERFLLTQGHRLEQALRCRNGTYQVDRALLELEDGLAFRANVDAFNAYLLSCQDGRRTLKEALQDATAAAGPKGAEPDDIESAALRVVRRMVELGFIAPVPRSPAVI